MTWTESTWRGTFTLWQEERFRDWPGDTDWCYWVILDYGYHPPGRTFRR